MLRRRTQSGIAVTLVVSLLVSASLAHAAASGTMRSTSDLEVRLQQPRAETMILDLVLLRPMGLIGTALGTAAFIISLPFSLPTKSADQAAYKLVVDPAKFTFARPLGEVEGFTDFP
jgi:hypothetical protein